MTVQVTNSTEESSDVTNILNVEEHNTEVTTQIYRSSTEVSQIPLPLPLIVATDDAVLKDAFLTSTTSDPEIIKPFVKPAAQAPWIEEGFLTDAETQVVVTTAHFINKTDFVLTTESTVAFSTEETTNLEEGSALASTSRETPTWKISTVETSTLTEVPRFWKTPTLQFSTSATPKTSTLKETLILTETTTKPEPQEVWLPRNTLLEDSTKPSLTETQVCKWI